MTAVRAAGAAVRIALGLLLVGLMVPFGIHALAKGDRAHVILAAAEVSGAVLFMIPRTVLAGGLTLLGCVAYALVVHRTLGAAVPLLYLALLLVACMLLDRALRGRSSRTQAQAPPSPDRRDDAGNGGSLSTGRPENRHAREPRGLPCRSPS